MPASQQYSCALITGASSGLGEEFANQLTSYAKRLVLVARRVDRLNELAEAIQSRHPDIKVDGIAADLGSSAACDSLLETLQQQGIEPDLLINNAGLGDYGEFASAEWSKTEAMISVNIHALTKLSHAISQGMIARKKGAIINISSLASTIFIPDFAVYAASKAYVSSFSEALRIELKPHGIPVLVVCPGPVKTEFGLVASRLPKGEGIPSMTSMSVTKEFVVSKSLTLLVTGKPRFYPGWKVAVAGALLRSMPLWITRIAMGLRPRKAKV